jgi:hypothetical protein
MELYELIQNKDRPKSDKEELPKMANKHSSYTGETYFDCQGKMS